VYGWRFSQPFADIDRKRREDSQEKSSFQHFDMVLDGLWVELDQLGQRIHEAATDRDGSAHGEVLIGKLVTGGFGGGVDRRARFVDTDNKNLRRKPEAAEEGFCLTAGCAVADGDRFDVVAFDQRLGLDGGAFDLAGSTRAVEDVVEKEFTLRGKN